MQYNLRKRAIYFGVIVLAGINALSLLGWFAGLDFFISVGSDFRPIAPLTAISFLVYAVTVFFYLKAGGDDSFRYVATVIISFLIVICVIEFIYHTAGLGFDFEGSVKGDIYSLDPRGHISPLTAIALASLFSLILYLIYRKTVNRVIDFVYIFATSVVLLLSVAIIATYIYGIPMLTAYPFWVVAVPTAVSFILSSMIALFLFQIKRPPSFKYATPIREKMLSVLLPLFLVIVFSYGIVFRYSDKLLRINTELTMLAVNILFLIVSVIIIIMVANFISRSAEMSNLARIKTEEALQESHELFRGITETALDAIMVSDDGDNIIVWNSAAAGLFQYTDKGIMGKITSGMILPDTLKNYYERMSSEGRSDDLMEVVVRNKEKKEFLAGLVVSEIKVGNKTYYMGLVRDITAIKDTEKTLKKKIDDMERLNAIMIDREKRIIELKEELKKIQKENL